MKKLLSNTFHFAYAKIKKSLRAAYATFPPPCFRLRMTYASLARPCAHQGFQRLFLMPYAEACAPLTQPFRPRCLSSNFSTELAHSLRGACATLSPLRRKNENACAMLARCLRNLPPATFSKCAQIFCLRGNFRNRAAYALLARCLRHACVLLTRDNVHQTFFNRSYILMLLLILLNHQP